jgi:hypothetical protein
MAHNENHRLYNQRPLSDCLRSSSMPFISFPFCVASVYFPQLREDPSSYPSLTLDRIDLSCPTISEHDFPADKSELMAVVVQIHRSRCAVAQAHMEPLVIVKLSIALYLFDQLGA